jgi:hypothetical protein
MFGVGDSMALAIVAGSLMFAAGYLGHIAKDMKRIADALEAKERTDELEFNIALYSEGG